MQQKLDFLPSATGDIDLDLVKLTEYLAKKYNLEHASGFAGEYAYGVYFKNDIFEMRPHYYGECDCGWENKLKAFGKKHKKKCFITKLSAYQDKLKEQDVEIMSTEWTRKITYWAKNNGYLKGWVGASTHCTCGHSKEFLEWYNKNKLGKNGHSPKCSLELPNFKYFKNSVEIRWYKWIGFGMEIYPPKGITDKGWKKIYEDVINSTL